MFIGIAFIATNEFDIALIQEYFFLLNFLCRTDSNSFFMMRNESLRRRLQ
jgi:hypothetical protein